ncbi:hypothetical protein CKC_04135 [Candidatus Liberibacter solanacearum CLso-ZC1]|uniref:Uncharacterized protein n=1 Tax=Liberibacter solanacearum (strain CLso-ZC1) TaxID=658172 RepID=E4UB97_LIBSC|nr:hypothetical protein CKC_04135 [Candidatus Liberibacter solanacearum CLso-ZC1]
MCEYIQKILDEIASGQSLTDILAEHERIKER